MNDHDETEQTPPAILLTRTDRALVCGGKPLTLTTYTAPDTLPAWHVWPADAFADRHISTAPTIHQEGRAVVYRNNAKERVGIEARVPMPDWIHREDVPAGEDVRRYIGAGALAWSIQYVNQEVRNAFISRLGLPATVGGRRLTADLTGERAWTEGLSVNLHFIPDLNRVRHDNRGAILDEVERLARTVVERTDLLDLFRDVVLAGLTRCAEDATEEARRETRILFGKFLDETDAYAGPKATMAEADAMAERARAIRKAAETLERAADEERRVIFARRWRDLTGEEG